MTSIAQFGDAHKMTEAEYRQRRESIRATYGDTATERTGLFDQELARLFARSNWTQERLAQAEGKSQQWVARRLRFGRFLAFTPDGVNPKNLTEGRFRGYWEQTDASEINENVRFRQVVRLMEQETILSRDTAKKPAIAAAIKTTSADGDWHRLSTIVTSVQAVVTEATEAEVKAVLFSMVFRSAYNVFSEKKKGAEVYRIVIGGKQKIDLVTLKQELGPIIAGLKAEGRKNMATMSPGTVAYLTAKLEKLIDKLAHLAPDDGAKE